MALPTGYVRVEYIQSSGGQYIDTGFIPNNKTKIEVQFMWNGGSNGYLYGAVDSSNKTSVTSTLSTSGGNWRFDGTTYLFKATANTLYTSVANSTGLTINNIFYNYAGTVSTFTSPNTLYIFSGHNSTGVSTSYYVGKIYYFKIYNDGVLTRDFVPCRNTNNEIGFYDLVNNQFYPNQGTGTFSAGADIILDYKIVNITNLNQGMTATANAIRTKAEHSQKIAWNPTTGFADAIEAISSGIKVATGTFTPTARGEYIYNNPITVSGLGFKPSRVIFFSSNADDSCGIISADTQTQQYTSYYYDEDEWEDEETGETVSETYYYVRSFDFDGELVITLNADGFKISATTQYTNASGYNILVWPYYCDFTYIALGE